MRKTFEQILSERRDLDLSSSAFDELIDLFQQIREATIKECIEKGYGLHYESAFDKNPTYVDVEDKSLEKLDKNSIEIYEI
jgi:diaminopimelate decarboxylase